MSLPTILHAQLKHAVGGTRSGTGAADEAIQCADGYYQTGAPPRHGPDVLHWLRRRVQSSAATRGMDAALRDHASGSFSAENALRACGLQMAPK